MPPTHFICPQTGADISFGEAPDYFENSGILPLEVTRLLVKEMEYDRRPHPTYLYPSALFPGLNCRRQLLIERFTDYGVDPRDFWTRKEGTIWHTNFNQALDAGDSWWSEVTLPDALGDRELLLKRDDIKECEDGRLRMEVYPNIWIRGRMDRPKKDWSEAVEHKTTGFPVCFPPNYIPKKEYTEEQKEEWGYQYSPYAHMVERVTGKRLNHIWTWRMYRGSRNKEFTWRKIPVRIWSEEQMWQRIRVYATSTVEMLQQGYKLYQAGDHDGVRRLIQGCPMDGHEKQMLNGTKCKRYCDVQPTCFGMKSDLFDF